MGNILVLHNGNKKVKAWITQEFADHTVMPCLACWEGASIDDKIKFLSENSNIVTDLTPADYIPPLDLAKIKKYCKVVKVITSYDSDLENLEDVWNVNDYSKEQWVECSVSRAWLSDSYVFLDQINTELVPKSYHKVAFTPGRSGTNVLMSLLSLERIFHHGFYHDDHPPMIELLGSAHIYAVLRKSFMEQLASDTLGRRVKVVITTEDNFSENQQMFQDCEFSIEPDDIEYTFNRLAYYADLLISLKMFWNHQNVHFCYYEDLKPHFLTVGVIKNPYDTAKVIKNYHECKKDIDQDIQTCYNNILSRIETLLGRNIY